MTTQALLAVLGTLAGLVYVSLGIAALKHVKDQLDVSDVDRVAGWSLWWWIERQKYNQRGQQLCLVGGVAFGIGVISWVLWFVLEK